jgi:hypothetical protein
MVPFEEKLKNTVWKTFLYIKLIAGANSVGIVVSQQEYQQDSPRYIQEYWQILQRRRHVVVIVVKERSQKKNRMLWNDCPMAWDKEDGDFIIALIW